VKVQTYIIVVLACALIITLVLWNNERKEAERYHSFIETNYQKSLIELTQEYSRLVNLTEALKKYNYRDELMETAIDNQLANLSRISSDLAVTTAVMKTETSLSEKLRMYSLHSLENVLKHSLGKKEDIDKVNQILASRLEELKELVYLDSNIFMKEENQLRIKEILEEIEAEISSKTAGAEMCEIIVEADPEGSGRVTGTGTYGKGQKVTVEAEPEEGFVFAGWKEGAFIRGFNKKFQFEVSGDIKLVAVFDDLEKAQFETTLPGTLGDREEAVPQLSPDHMHLLGLQNGTLTLNKFPENNLISIFPVEEKHRVRGFKWAPQGDAFAYHTDYEEPGGGGGVYIAKLDGATEKVAALEQPDLVSRQILWSPCG
jgi:hypothetical protein